MTTGAVPVWARAGEESSRETAGTRRFAFPAAVGVIVLSIGYGVPLTVGLLTPETPDSPIAEPWFSMMEVFILLSTPMMVGPVPFPVQPC
ncbi:hypothetical protein [Kineococcus sp. R86509]|uniref:hypothetical protein n=1 Tax=Kineococcus sp. R86509 TaxID=3093851 RepID=UPI0036D350C7